MPIAATTGSEIAFAVNPATKRMMLTWAGGDVAFDDNATETILSLLVENEGPFTANRRRGPGPMSVAVDDADAPSKIKSRAEERLQLALDDGRLASINVSVPRIGGRLILSVAYVTGRGYKGLVEYPVGS